MIAQSVMRAFHRLVVLLRSLREISREARPAALARQMIPDVAYGLRLFRKAQAFSATCVLIVALGIAATTAIFSVVHGVALRPLPYRDPDRFGEVALVRAIANFNLTGYGEPERLFAARVSASTFRVLGVAPAIGRTFADDENQIGRDRVVRLQRRTLETPVRGGTCHRGSRHHVERRRAHCRGGDETRLPVSGS